MIRKLIVVLLSVLLISSMTVVAFAASEEPDIILQPQSPNYPQYSVAIYTVKATGTNLTATWYMEWLGDTYTISDIGGSMQAWEAYAGEAYGARKLDDNTFAFIFEGIEYDLDGAYIWCVIEDGHYDVTSQKARMSVGNENMPPEIVDIPSMLTVEQGDEAEIRCVAKSSDGTELSFLWYETDTGRMEDMRAVNRGTETSDYIFCDTSVIGTRNYICMVETSAGGIAYSSVVPVTVTEKQVVETAPQEPSVNTPDTTEPVTTEPQAPETEVTDPVAEPSSPTPEKEPETTVPTQESDNTETEQETTEQESTELPEKDEIDDAQEKGLPWWSLVIIGLVGIGAGIGAAIILIRKNQK